MVVKTRISPLGKLANNIKTLFHIIYCFFALYLSLVILSIPLFLLFCYRLVLKITFSLFYNGQLRLVECANACFATESYGNVFAIYYFLYFEGPCDIDLLRQRVHRIFTTFKDKNGKRAYEVMLCSVVQKFGFYCLKNSRDTFDIKHHIRFLPGCNDPNKVYTEAEVLEAAGNLADDLWDEDKPHWEILIVSQMKKDVTGEISNVMYFRFGHVYVDGISLVQIIRLCVTDKPAKKLYFDPVNPPVPPMPLWLKLLTYLQIFFLGPWASLKFLGREDNNIFCEGPLTGTKFFGRSTLDIPMNSLRKIRKKYGCTTGAIQHYCVSAALGKIAEKRGYPLPDTALGSLIFAKLPFPNAYPQNRVVVGTGEIPIGIMRNASISEKLTEVNRSYQDVTHHLNYYGLLTSRIFFIVIGLFPATLVGKMFGQIKFAYALSNVPGQTEVSYFNGNKLTTAFGTGPLINEIRYTCGIFCYADKMSFGFQSEKSSLIRDRLELLELIDEFDIEMKTLMDGCNEEENVENGDKVLLV